MVEFSLDVGCSTRKAKGILLLLIISFSLIASVSISPFKPAQTQAEPSTVTYFPNAAGTYTQLDQYPSSGEHWDKVDEDPHDGDTTYIHTSSSNKIDSFNFEDPTGTGTDINVTVVITVRSTSSVYPGAAYCFIRTYNNDYVSSTYINPGTSYTEFSYTCLPFSLLLKSH